MSSHLRSLERRTLVFGLLAVLLGLGLWLMPEGRTSVKKENLPLVFADFERAAAKRIELNRGDAGVILEEGNQDRWHLASHFRYPLATAPKRLLDALSSARLSAEVTRRAETFAKYAGSRGWTEVTVVDNRGRETLRFAVGLYKYPETFLRLGQGDEQRIVKATGISESDVNPEPRFWIETRMWPDLTAANMVRIDVEQRRDQRTLTLARRGELPADVEMAVPEKDEKGEKIYWMASPVRGDAKKLAVEDLAREFTGMLIEDVLAGSTTSEEAAQYGFEDPELVVTFWHKAGEALSKHVLTIGKRVEGKDQWTVRRDAEGWVFLVDAGSGVSRMRQSPDDFLEKDESAETDPEKPGDGK